MQGTPTGIKRPFQNCGNVRQALDEKKKRDNDKKSISEATRRAVLMASPMIVRG